MTITVEDVAPCQKRLKIEVPANRVQEAYDRVTSEFQKEARIPGFRPGHAPRNVILKKFQRDIQSETQRSLVPEAFREAVAEKKLRIVAQPNIEDVQYQPGNSLSFSTLVELAPDIRLPEYRGLVVKRASTEVTPADVDTFLVDLANQRAHFHPAHDRALAEGDFAVITYSATVGGEPLVLEQEGERQLASGQKFWLWVRPEAFIPGFAEKLVGQQIGESRTFEIAFAPDFGAAVVAGKTVVYQVELNEIQVRHAPEIDDEFAQDLAKVDLAELKTRLHDNLQRDKANQVEGQARQQVIDQLNQAVDFPLPPSAVEGETQQALNQIVEENQRRGISAQALEDQKEKIFAHAERDAREMVKFKLIAAQIAEKEAITVSNDEFGQHLAFIAMREGITPDKLVDRLRKQDALGDVREFLLRRKVLDFLLKEAKTE